MIDGGAQVRHAKAKMPLTHRGAFVVLLSAFAASVASSVAASAQEVDYSAEMKPDTIDEVVVRDAEAARRFDARFERMRDAAQSMIEFEPAIRPLEPNELAAARARAKD